MSFKPMNTSDDSTNFRKVLLYAHHGWGKTSQAKNYQKKFGKGFIISGESGLSSVREAGVDYLPFSSWDGVEDHAKGVYSFRGIIRLMNTPEFKAQEYKWIMIDSLTELSDLAYVHADAEATRKAKDGKVNGFAVWEEYGAMVIGACKWVRDLPMHVIITSLAKEGEDENGNKEFWPMVKGKQVQQQLPGIFDCVLCGIRRTSVETDKTTNKQVTKTTRYIVTDEVSGWHGKVRDEGRRLQPVEIEDDVTRLIDRMMMPASEYQAWLDKK